jgi:dihydroorotase
VQRYIRHGAAELSDIFIAGNLVGPEGIAETLVGFSEETGLVTSVCAVGPQTGTGLLIFPGFIDIHAHAREFPAPACASPAETAAWNRMRAKETFATACAAAINGGVTRICAMPNDPAPPDGARSFAAKARLTEGLSCEVTLFAAVTRTSAPWEDLLYKVYLDRSPSATAFDSWSELESVLARYRGAKVFFHAEDPEILKRFTSAGSRWKSRPPEAEERAVARILELTDRFSLRAHVCHVSTRKALELIVARNSSAAEPVTCEVTPHHLFFSVDETGVRTATGKIMSADTRFDCNPPLRSEDDRRFLLHALKSGIIDALATDHAPHTLEDKRSGAPGMPQLDTFGAFVCRLIRDEAFDPQRVCEITAVGPAAICSTKAGPISAAPAVGGFASFTVLDMNRPTIVEAHGLRNLGPFGTRCGWSPFEGETFPGSVAATVARGVVHDVSGRSADMLRR